MNKHTIAETILFVNATVFTRFGGFVVAGKISTVAHHPADKFTNKSERSIHQAGSSFI